MRPLSLYIHWPFCKSKCPYCDFNSHVRAGVADEAWREALLKEMRCYAALVPDREIVSIFFGGGTPSLMQAQTVAALIEEAGRLWKMAEHAEITLEANPTSVEAHKFNDFCSAGVNRVSIGVQSLNERDLKFLGREHSTTEAIRALELAATIFPRFSFDLIYALPGQTLPQWEKELQDALQFARGHLSLYQLTIEENTAFYSQYHKGGFVLPEEHLAADMYQLTQEITESYGLPAYEISNHAAPLQESRHNLAYWRYDDYIGLGAGAHGRFTCSQEHQHTRLATENIKSPERWLEKVQQQGRGLAEETVISEAESYEEALIMGMRLSKGIEYANWQERTGLDIKQFLELSAPAALEKISRAGYITTDSDHLQATWQGRLVLNTVLKELLVTKD